MSPVVGVSILKSKIVVVPLGEVDFMMVNKLASNLGPIFNRSVDILKGMKMPGEAFNVVRNQYYAQVLLSKVERSKANSREKVIAICEEDLYLPDKNTVMSSVDPLSGTAVVSLYHLRQEFYGLPDDETRIYPRLYKETLYLLAKLFELSSCRNPRCVNFYGRELMDIDEKTERFCDICRRSLTNTLV